MLKKKKSETRSDALVFGLSLDFKASNLKLGMKHLLRVCLGELRFFFCGGGGKLIQFFLRYLLVGLK